MDVEGRAVLKQSSLLRDRAPHTVPRSRGLSQSCAGYGSNPARLYRHRVQGGIEPSPVCPGMPLPTASSDRANRRYESTLGCHRPIVGRFRYPASCRGDNDFQEIALISSELDVWH